MKPKFLADENFETAIVTALRRSCPGIDVLTHAEAGLLGRTDAEVLAFAKSSKRILITHDRRLQSLARSSSHSGIFIVKRASFRSLLTDLQLVWDVSDASEWENVVRWLPL